MNKPSVDPYDTNLHKGNAYWMARLSSEVYKRESEDDGKPDACKILKSLTSDDTDFQSVKGFDKRSAQAALIEHKNYLCMAFRGTEWDEGDDIRDSIRAILKKELFGRFHEGYWQSVEDLWDCFCKEYEKLIKRRERPLFFAGHSIGGAMAVIASARFLHHDRPFASVYTFGQPRTMGYSTARKYNSKAKSPYYRFRNDGDIVPRLPPWWALYRHAGHCVFIDKDGNIEDDPSRCNNFLDIFGVRPKEHSEFLPYHGIRYYLKAIEKWATNNNP